MFAEGEAGVASGHPLATSAGMAALSAGGSAADAALASAFTQWVVNAPLCGPGGDLVALATSGEEVTTYGGWSRVPLGIDPSAPLEASGPRGAVVPGSLRGAEALWKALGRLPWSDLFSGALDAAAGHEITPRMEAVFALVAAKGHGQAMATITNATAPPVAGDVIAVADWATRSQRLRPMVQLPSTRAPSRKPSIGPPWQTERGSAATTFRRSAPRWTPQPELTSPISACGFRTGPAKPRSRRHYSNASTRHSIQRRPSSPRHSAL